MTILELLELLGVALGTIGSLMLVPAMNDRKTKLGVIFIAAGFIKPAYSYLILTNPLNWLGIWVVTIIFVSLVLISWNGKRQHHSGLSQQEKLRGL